MGKVIVLMSLWRPNFPPLVLGKKVSEYQSVIYMTHGEGGDTEDVEAMRAENTRNGCRAR